MWAVFAPCKVNTISLLQARTTGSVDSKSCCKQLELGSSMSLGVFLSHMHHDLRLSATWLMDSVELVNLIVSQ